MQDKSVNTELDNTYQKVILTENDKKKESRSNERMVHIE